MQNESSPVSGGGVNMTMGWRTVALWMTVISATALGALVVIAAVKSADVLSTVALSLAILAFAAQLVIALAQGQSASQQLLHSERVNTATQTLLAEVRVTSQGLLSTSREQFDFVLHSALQRAIPAAVEESSQEETGEAGVSFETRLTERLTEALRPYLQQTSLPQAAQAPPAPKPEASAEEMAIARRMATYPETAAEGERLYRKLRELSPFALTRLQRKAEREIFARRTASPPIGTFMGSEGSPATEELIARGLAVELPPPSDASEGGRRYSELTLDGRELARVLTGRGPAPEWLRQLMRVESELPTGR